MSWQATLQASLMNMPGVGVKASIGNDTTEYGSDWTLADPGRAQMYLRDEWASAAYWVALPANVRSNPEFMYGARIRNLHTGLEAVIRHIDNASTAGDTFTINVLAAVVDR